MRATIQIDQEAWLIGDGRGRWCRPSSTPPVHADPAPSGGTVGGIGEAPGRSQGGFSTKLHLRTEGGSKSIMVVLTATECHKLFAPNRLVDEERYYACGRRPRLLSLRS